MSTARDIINISLPKEMARAVRQDAKSGGYSVSEYVRHILREWKRETLARELNADRKLFEKGK
jgi:Arc/MetJ-type ribon-helix-helix transcriptional regulator